jgi:hypothetical protein
MDQRYEWVTIDRFSATIMRMSSITSPLCPRSRPMRQLLKSAIRVDIVMSDSSAIHNTGHYHVRPRPVCLVAFLRLICKQRAQPPQLRVLASLDLATLDAGAVSEDSAYRLKQTWFVPMRSLIRRDAKFEKLEELPVCDRPATGSAGNCGVEAVPRANVVGMAGNHWCKRGCRGSLMACSSCAPIVNAATRICRRRQPTR